MTDDKPTPRSTQTVVIAVLVGLLLVAGGVVIGLLVTGDGETVATTTTTVPPPTTTITVATTTTTSPPTTTTTTLSEPENQAMVTVSEDTTVDSDEPDVPAGNGAVIEVDQDGPDTKRGLLRFEVEGVPEGQTVVSAILTLLQLDESAQGGSVSFVGGPWTEAETTWAAAPPVGEVIAPLPGGVDGMPVEIDVTAAVTGNGTFDFYLTTLFDDSMEYAAKESGSGPTLTVVWGETETAEAAVLVGAGDIASCESDGDEITADLIGQVAATAEELVVFTAGDNAYESGTLQEFNECYDPTWGQFKAMTRPAPGAREYRTEDAVGYFAYFGSTAGDVGEGYYSYDLGGWHVVVLNSNCAEVGGCQDGSPQEEWLNEDLSEFSAACTLAYWHHPLFSSSPAGGNPEVRELFDALNDADAEIVINADNHFYERFEPQDPEGLPDENGVRQFTVGTGGRSLDNVGTIAANSAARFDEAFGVLALSLRPGGYDWNFITEEGVAFTDTGSASCQ